MTTFRSVAAYESFILGTGSDQPGFPPQLINEIDDNEQLLETSNNTILKKVFTQLIEPQELSELSKCGITSLKAVVVIACFASQWPSVLAASEISDQVGWKILFGAGELAAWGAVYSACSLEIIEELTSEHDLHQVHPEKGNCLKVAYWVGIVALAILVQTSDIYISYKYTDESFFWPIYVGIIYAIFTTTSLHKAFRSATQTSNRFTRFITSNPDKLSTLNAKKTFVEALENFAQMIDVAHPEIREEFSFVIDAAKANSSPEILLRYVLLKGLEEKNQKLVSETRGCMKAASIIQLLGPALYCGNLYLDTRLVSEASKLIYDNPYFTFFLIIFSTSPNVFLDLEMTCSTIRNLYWGIWDMVKACKKVDSIVCNRKTVIKSAANVSVAFFSIFGLGSSITVANDTIGFKKNPFVCSVILTFTALLTADSLKGLHEKLINKTFYYFDEEETKKVKKIARRFDHLNREIIKMSKDDFGELVSQIVGEGEVSSNFKEDLAKHLKDGKSAIEVLQKTEIDGLLDLSRSLEGSDSV